MSNSSAIPEATEKQLLDLMDEWSAAVSAKDLDRLMKLYAPDVLFFNVVPPMQTRGAEAYRESWEQTLPYLPSELGTDIRDIKIHASGDLALIHCTNRLVNLTSGEAATCGCVRVTLGLEKQDGAWKVVHEHVSVPFDPMSSKAVLQRDFPE